MLVNVNWNTFKAKFGEASEAEFQLLCTLVFCRMYNRPFGIEAYRNHPGLESTTIEVNGKNVGFQAKFFLDKFSSHKSKILQAVLQAKKYHPELDELVFFLPMDLDFNSQGKGGKLSTKAQHEVENAAKGLTIKWFGHSQFQTTLSDKAYEYWTCHFFHLSPDILKLVESVEHCKERRFRNARNSIDVNGFHVALDRSGSSKTILESQDRVIVVTGEGGVGKTSLLKSVDDDLSGSGFYCVGLRELSDIFAEQNLASSWHIGLTDFLDLHSDCNERFLVVDEAEKTELLVPPGDTGRIVPILEEFHNAGWKIVFSSRSSHAEMWVNFCKDSLHAQPAIVEIPSLLPEELNRIANSNGFSVPSDFLLRDLLRIPFYLKEFLSLSEGERAGNFRDFKRHLWNCRIQGSDSADMTANVFVAMIDRRLQTGDYWVDVRPEESEAVKRLMQRNILVRDMDTERYYLAHDIYEEWALEKIITRAFSDVGDSPDLWSRLHDKPAMHRAYRSWLTDRLHLDGPSVQNLMDESLSEKPTSWQKETLLAILASPLAESFLERHKEHLLENDGQELKEIVSLIRLSYREPIPLIKNTLLSDMGYDPKSAEFSFLTRPCGRAWETLIHFLSENREDVLKVKQGENLNLFHDWCSAHPQGLTTAEAARLALEIAIANIGTDWKTHLYERKNEKLLFHCLSFGAAEIKEELLEFIGAYLDDHQDSYRGFPKNYCETIVNDSLSHVHFIAALPDLTRRILSTMFRPTPQLPTLGMVSPEEKMGLSRQGLFVRGPLSAYQTPWYYLLKNDLVKSLPFMIDWINDLASAWAKSDSTTMTTTFVSENGKRYEQSISEALWCANRGCGSPVLPNLFVCAHMALEKCLLEFDADCHDEEEEKLLVKICLYIFQKAKTASLSGVLNTLVLKNPDRYFEVGSLLASSFEAIVFDYVRAHRREADCKFLYPVLRRDEWVYWKEREKTLNESFRFNSLGKVIRWYQSCPSPEGERRRKRMEKLLDGFSQTKDQIHLEMVCRMDLRRFRLECKQNDNGESILVAYPQLPPEMVEDRRKSQETLDSINLGLGLKHWAEHKIKGDTIPTHLSAYETDKQKLLNGCKTVLSASYEGEVAILLQNAKPVISAALLSCFREGLDDEMLAKCQQMVLQAIQTVLSSSFITMEMSSFDMAYIFSVLAVLADDPDQVFAEEAWRYTLLGMLLEVNTPGIDQEIFDAIRKKAEVNKGYERKFVAPYLRVKTEYAGFLKIPEVKKQLLSWKQSSVALFMESRADFLKELRHSEKEVDLSAIGIYSAEAAMNCLCMIPDTALEDGFCKDVFLENIERILPDIYRVDEQGYLRQEYLDPASQRYRTHFARLLLHLGAEERADVLAQVEKVPLALADRYFLEAIVHAANMAKARNAFWEIWTTLRPTMGKLLKDKGLYMRQMDLEEAVGAYFLGRQVWWGHPEACQLVERGDLQFFNQCLEEWNMPLMAVVAFQSFLESAGLPYWEEGLPMLGSILEHIRMGTGDGLETILAENCGQYMKQMVSEHADTIRKRTRLRQAALSIVQFLKAEKSLAGYDLENHIV